MCQWIVWIKRLTLLFLLLSLGLVIFTLPLAPAIELQDDREESMVQTEEAARVAANSEPKKKGDSVFDSDMSEALFEKAALQPRRYPQEYRVSVPFISQAPFGDWGEPYQEACEEAALLMASAYFNKEKAVSKKFADNRIQKLVSWEKEHFGSYEHTDTKQTAKMADEYFSLQTKVITDFSEDTIKSALLEGKLVLAPTAGRMLGNPYYSAKGPLYHMLLIIGWDEAGFITNDPGTKRGENYHYPYGRIMKAIHDWNNGDIYSGTPMIITVFSL